MPASGIIMARKHDTIPRCVQRMAEGKYGRCGVYPDTRQERKRVGRKYPSGGVYGLFTKPITVIQLNWMKIQDYYHEELISMANHRFGFPYDKLSFAYVPSKKTRGPHLIFI